LTIDKCRPDNANSLSAEIYNYCRFTEIREFEATVLSLSVGNTHGDPYGKVSSGSLTIFGFWKSANNSIFAKALLDNQDYPRLIVQEDGSIIDDVIEENYPLFSFDFLSEEDFHHSQTAFRRHYDESSGTTTNEEQRKAKIQIRKD
jgi:hypothetical protein